jgi:hypothetical protein
MHRVRPIIAVVLAVLGGITLATANIALWARTEIVDRDHVVAQSEEILASPAVREAIAVQLVSELRDASRVDTGIEKLPDFLEGPANDALNFALEEIQNQIIEALARRPVAALWQSSVASFHEQLIDNDSDELTLGLEEVTDAISPEVTEAIEPVREFLNIPESWGRFTVLTRDELPELWLTLLALEKQSPYLPWLGLALVGGGVALSRRRLVAGSIAAFSLAAASLVAVPLFRQANEQLFNTSDAEVNQRAADAVWGILFAPVYGRIALVAVVGVAIGVAALGAELIMMQRKLDKTPEVA